jgi:alginate O-acetyltransferase complex protein AlgI
LNKLPRLQAALAMLTTFSLVTFAWIYFRAASLQDALYITRHLVSGWPSYLAGAWNIIVEGWQRTADLGLYALVDAAFRALDPMTNESRAVIALTVLALLILLTIEILQYRLNLLERLNQKPVYLRRVVYASLLASILILGTSYASVQQAFIYFQF